jgi:hypothetical protein
MKRSFLTVAAVAAFSMAACGGADDDANIEPIDADELAPPPAPAPAQPMPMDTMGADTTGMMGDTMGMTTTGM